MLIQGQEDAIVLLGLRVVTLTSGEWTVEDTSYLIGHLSFRLYPECIMILYGDTDISSVKRTADIVKLEKFLWRRTSKMVGVMHYRDYGQTTKGCLSRPMFVLLVLQLGTTKMVTGFVGFVGQPVKTPRTPIWLILTNATIPDEFFYGMYPAMSSEMVWSAQTIQRSEFMSSSG
uniref:Uncharacterized protein n=1 Tax=Timema cristinae TaxID=61476 RepID=A0A7R9H9G6_TIMCR|nr:unnamed protein product [Timema cristinae]